MIYIKNSFAACCKTKRTQDRRTNKAENSILSLEAKAKQSTATIAAQP
jgi:hypothetical protein